MCAEPVGQDLGNRLAAIASASGKPTTYLQPVWGVGHYNNTIQLRALDKQVQAFRIMHAHDGLHKVRRCGAGMDFKLAHSLQATPLQAKPVDRPV